MALGAIMADLGFALRGVLTSPTMFVAASLAVGMISATGWDTALALIGQVYSK